MPELDDTHISLRLQKRIADLEAGDEFAKHHMYAVLHEQQQQESELSVQQALKTQSRARTDEEKMRHTVNRTLVKHHDRLTNAHTVAALSRLSRQHWPKTKFKTSS